MKSKQFYKAMAICAISLMGFNATTNAQVRFGPILGANFSNQSGDVDGNKMLIGGHLGVLFNFSLTDNIRVEPQVLFSMQGAKYEYDIPFFGKAKYDLKMNYIDIPIWFRYQTEGGFNIQAGPYVGFLLSAKSESGSDKQDVKDNYKSLDVGVGGGIGYQLGSGLGFAANYNVGLANVADASNVTIKNSVIRLSVSYTLGGQ